MFEVYVLAEKKKSSLMMKILEIFFLGLAVISVLFLVLGNFLLLPFALLFGWIWSVLRNHYVEYEYSYFDGEARFAKIINKSKRKRLPSYNMTDVIIFAPAGDRSLYQYEQDRAINLLDYTTGNPEAKVYAMVMKNSEGTTMVRFEPDEKYLDAVCMKFQQKVVR